MTPGPIARLRITLLERSLRATQQLTARLDRQPQPPPHLLLGLRGEQAAYFHLRRLGYTVIARQWRTAKLRGDLDLIAYDGPTLCFIEVKTRARRDAFPAESAVDKEKRAMLRRMARAYLYHVENAAQIPLRFDVLSVYFDRETPHFDCFRNAFGWSEPGHDDRWY